MAVFVRYVTSDVIVKEDLLDLVELKDTTRGVDIKEALETVLVKANAPINKLVNVASDGWQTCWTYWFIKKQFKNFINELDLADKPNDLSFYCAVRWLSSTEALFKFVELLEPIKGFLIERKKTFEILDDINFLQDLMFLTDIMQHLQSLNLSLQGKEKIISNLAQTIFSFQKKIILFQKDLTLKAFNHFPQMKKMIISNPLIHDGCPIPSKMVEEVSQFETELLDLQEDQNLVMLHKTLTLLQFWKIVTEVAKLTEHPAEALTLASIKKATRDPNKKDFVISLKVLQTLKKLKSLR
ncbi:protein FAM200B-like [Hydra vulgaris]|uniref:Protein FAM200B-like n=1 Tax=Hydra vulgaris TaxID=6087 RepID=A0ABM4BP99_HYDVU